MAFDFCVAISVFSLDNFCVKLYISVIRVLNFPFFITDMQ